MKKSHSIVSSSVLVIPMLLSLVGCAKPEEFQAPVPAEQRSKLNSVIGEINSAFIASVYYSSSDIEKHTKDELALKIQKVLYDKQKLCTPLYKMLDIGFSYFSVSGKSDDDLEKGEEGCPFHYYENAKVVKQSETIKKEVMFVATSADIQKLTSLRYFSSAVVFPNDYLTSKSVTLDISGNISLGDKSNPGGKYSEIIDFKGSLNVTESKVGESTVSQMDATLNFKYILNSPSYTTEVKISQKGKDEKLQGLVAGQELSETDAKMYRDFLSSIVSPK